MSQAKNNLEMDALLQKLKVHVFGWVLGEIKGFSCARIRRIRHCACFCAQNTRAERGEPERLNPDVALWRVNGQGSAFLLSPTDLDQQSFNRLTNKTSGNSTVCLASFTN
jgi:hypothetical protein